MKKQVKQPDGSWKDEEMTLQDEEIIKSIVNGSDAQKQFTEAEIQIASVQLAMKLTGRSCRYGC